MPTKDPKFWIIPALVGLLGGGGATTSVQWWQADQKTQQNSLVDYRLMILEEQQDILAARLAGLPPQSLIEKLAEIDVRLSIMEATQGP